MGNFKHHRIWLSWTFLEKWRDRVAVRWQTAADHWRLWSRKSKRQSWNKCVVSSSDWQSNCKAKQHLGTPVVLKICCDVPSSWVLIIVFWKQFLLISKLRETSIAPTWWNLGSLELIMMHNYLSFNTTFIHILFLNIGCNSARKSACILIFLCSHSSPGLSASWN